jgi:hypothetical protein
MPIVLVVWFCRSAYNSGLDVYPKREKVAAKLLPMSYFLERSVEARGSSVEPCSIRD